jgi:dTDP-3-amino-3,4,6-trideoxy-alpha-D-glucose transaminase
MAQNENVFSRQRSTMDMPAFLDVGYTYFELRSELDAAWHQVMESGVYVQGPNVTAFEADYARYCGVEHCVGVATGYDALTLSLRAVGVQADDEVLVSGHTFIATWLAILALGAKPVPVDADPETMLIDPTLIIDSLTHKTRALVIVSLYGLPVDLGIVAQILRERGIAIIEDAAQAHGATLNGIRAGAIGDIAGFSFYPGKNLGAFGDAGGVTTSRADWAESIRGWANYGARVKYQHEEIGLNSRLDELQAALLRVKLSRLDQWTEQRRKIADRYIERLSAIPALTLPAKPAGANPAWHAFVVRHSRRNALMAGLGARGVQTLMHYPTPPHRSKALRCLFPNTELPITEMICDTCISLPIGPHMSPLDVNNITDAVIDAVHAVN